MKRADAFHSSPRKICISYSPEIQDLGVQSVYPQPPCSPSHGLVSMQIISEPQYQIAVHRTPLNT